MFRNLPKKINMLAGAKKVSGHRFARTRLVVLARNNLNQVCSKQTSSTGTLGSTPERTQLVVLARNSFSTKHHAVQAYVVSKRPAMCRHHCLRFKQNLDALQTPKSVSSTLAAKICGTLCECRSATTFCYSQHANALFSEELGTLINSSFYSLLTLGGFAISSPQQKLDIAGGCTATSPYITSKKL